MVNYATGAGGKFFISMLLLFDQMAHWDPQVAQGRMTYDQWFNQAWAQERKFWVKTEPNCVWNSFYSRQWPRNEHLTPEQFNQLVQSQSDPYFHECWDQGLIIIEHWHKAFRPAFFANARWMEILVTPEDMPVYQHLVMSKLYIWDQQSKTVLSTLEHPDWANSPETRNRILQYNNQYTISGYDSSDDFFQRWFLTQSTISCFVDAAPDPSCVLSLTLGDLVDKQRFFDLMSRLENLFGQKHDRQMINRYHDVWLARSGLPV